MQISLVLDSVSTNPLFSPRRLYDAYSAAILGGRHFPIRRTCAIFYYFIFKYNFDF